MFSGGSMRPDLGGGRFGVFRDYMFLEDDHKKSNCFNIAFRRREEVGRSQTHQCRIPFVSWERASEYHRQLRLNQDERDCHDDFFFSILGGQVESEAISQRLPFEGRIVSQVTSSCQLSEQYSPASNVTTDLSTNDKNAHCIITESKQHV